MKSPHVLLLGALVVFGAGCATVPYDYGQRLKTDRYYVMPEDEPQIEVGRPVKVLDVAGWIWGIPSKIILWNSKVDNHYVSDDTSAAIREYLALNELSHVKVRINQYRPGAEWKRLFRNKHTNPAWRYTLGVLSVTFYTALPGRFFGGDNYNPYSNTVNLYSDVPTIAMHEGGHAKDFAERTYKGTYAALYMLPFAALYHEAVASNDAFSYMRAEQDADTEKDGYKILYPAYGTYVGGGVGNWLAFPYNLIVYAAGVIPGHIIGRVKSATLDVPREGAPQDVVDQGSGKDDDSANTAHE
ncbi:MAG: hypothetical protein O3C57_01195 [Verrucomicrobia bacterium]|nr:hypothetical protein [Verrucomicrobiota bacterium]